MSYILDALRKSEQQRLQQSVPSLGQAPLTQPSAPASGRGRLWGLLAAALLLIGGIVIGSLRPWQSAAPLPETVAAMPRVPVAEPPVAVSPSPPAPAPAPVEAPVEPAMPAPVASPPPPPLAVATPPAPPPAAPASKPAALPLPPITITVHAYAASPRERLAGINGKLLQEGELIAPGLKLEKITEDGVILNFQGQRFRRQI